MQPPARLQHSKAQALVRVVRGAGRKAVVTLIDAEDTEEPAQEIVP